MVHRLNTSDRQFILHEMLALARYLTGKGIQPPTTRAAVRRLRDDLLTLLRAGSTSITVDKESYLPATIDKETQP